MALAAAFDDPRFPPLAEEELHDLRLEISVVSPPETSPPELIVAGWHGVCITIRDRKAVFLPQVAREEDWSRRVLLEQLCLKAGAEPAAWREPDAELATFTAEIFGDP
jgi:AmmeMemoRadiSam system protein A